MVTMLSYLLALLQDGQLTCLV